MKPSSAYWQRLEQLFHQAIELDEPARRRFLGEACAGDTALREEVESLVASHAAMEGLNEECKK